MRPLPHADSPEFEALLREALNGYPCEPGRRSCPNPERCAELRAQAEADFAAWPWWRRTSLGWRTDWQLWWLVQRQKLQRLRESRWR